MGKKPEMLKEIVRAYLWQDIIRKAFSPKSSRDQNSWLHQYSGSLKKFWGLDFYPALPKSTEKGFTATINSSIALSFEYFIEAPDKFLIMMLHTPPIHDHHIWWTHDMDGKYFVLPLPNLLTDRNEKRTFIHYTKTEDIEAVVDSLIVHPTPHQHIASPVVIPDEDADLQEKKNHDIRIGGGITNPLVYLFHLRFQLCPDRILRKEEKKRLVDLFEAAVKNNSDVSANELMRIP